MSRKNRPTSKHGTIPMSGGRGPPNRQLALIEYSALNRMLVEEALFIANACETCRGRIFRTMTAEGVAFAGECPQCEVFLMSWATITEGARVLLPNKLELDRYPA